MAAALPPNDELRTWKEIATYLGVSVREAQNREKQDGLPVHRLPGVKPQVWATRSELDAWKAAAGKPGPGAEVPRDFPEPAAAGPTLPPRPNRRGALAGIGGALAAATGITAWVKHGSSKRSPARAAFNGNSISVWDDDGVILWSYRFQELLDQDPLNGISGADRRSALVDFDGSGRRHVVALASVRQGAGQTDKETVYCFTPEGKILWRYHPSIHLTFGDTVFSGPWLITDMNVVPDGAGGAEIWFSLIHEMSRPSALISFGLSGTPSIQFVNCGYVYAFRYVANPSGRFILAASVNNEYEKASLAILKAGMPARSPQTAGTRFECVDAPKGSPLKYFLFPPTDVSRALNLPYTLLKAISGPDNALTMHVVENIEGGANALYLLSADFEPVEVTYDEGFAVAHRQLEVQGRIKHPLAECPHLTKSATVERWDPVSGWTKTIVLPSKNVKPGGTL